MSEQDTKTTGQTEAATEEFSRREAAQKLGRYAAYTAPVMLALATSKAAATT